MIRNGILMLLVVGAMIPNAGLSQGSHAHMPADVVNGFHEALTAGQKDTALEFLDAEVVIFESGGAELSRAEYSSHHLEADMGFSEATTRKVEDQRVGQDGEVAWVLTRTATTGTFRDKEIDARGVETMLLRHSSEGWRIFHIHWSSRSNRSD